MLPVHFLPHSGVSELRVTVFPYMAHVYTPRTPFSDNFFPTEALVDFFILRFPGDPVGGWKPGDEKNDGAVWGYEPVQKGSVGKTYHLRKYAGNMPENIL